MNEMTVKASLARRISMSMASFIAEYDKSSSDVAAYIEQRLTPMWRLASEVASEMHDAWARVGDDTPRDHPDVRYAAGYEAGIRDAVKVVRAELEAIANDVRKLQPTAPDAANDAAF